MSSARRHEYFAYGSNLDAVQMARRCPDAGDPRPATLPGYDWLINERGVATVTPSAAGRVHGVLWQVSDADLSALDAAEGVPVRYRRDRLTVHGQGGPTGAWVYVDPRARPGAPRPGYLERVLGGAAAHALPASWLDALRGWHAEARRDRSAPGSRPAPGSLTDLLDDPHVIETSTLRSPFGFMAIHGGGLEKMTDVIAQQAAAAAGASVYVVDHPPDYPHHLPSAFYLASQSVRLAEFLDHVEVVVSLHGYGRIGRSRDLLAGGRNRWLARHLAAEASVPGYRVVTDLDAIPAELRGLHPDNPVNQPRGGGAQLELTARVRGLGRRSGPPVSAAALIDGLARAAQGWSAAIG